MSAQISFFDNEFERLCEYWQRNHREYLACLRALAVRIAERKGDVATDDLREEMERLHVPMPHDMGCDDRLLSSALRFCNELKCVGRRETHREERVKRSGANASVISVYRLAL